MEKDNEDIKRAVIDARATRGFALVDKLFLSDVTVIGFPPIENQTIIRLMKDAIYFIAEGIIKECTIKTTCKVRIRIFQTETGYIQIEEITTVGG